MSFIEGDSLRVRAAKHGQLPVRDAVQILREIADALSYAHATGSVIATSRPTTS